MVHSYLVEIIKSLPRSDWERVSQMVVSPPFGGAGNAALVQQLFEIICAASPEFDEKVLDKELVYQQLFPNQPWIQGKLDKLMVELVRLLRQYILISRYLSKPNEANVSLEWSDLQSSQARWIRSHSYPQVATTKLPANPGWHRPTKPRAKMFCRHCFCRQTNSPAPIVLY